MKQNLRLFIDLTENDFKKLLDKDIFIINDYCTKTGEYVKVGFKKYRILNIRNGKVFTSCNKGERAFTIADVRPLSKIAGFDDKSMRMFYKWLNANRNMFNTYTSAIHTSDKDKLKFILDTFNNVIIKG